MYKMGMKITFMMCIVVVNKLSFLKICRKYDRQFISMMHVSMHEDHLVHKYTGAVVVFLTWRLNAL